MYLNKIDVKNGMDIIGGKRSPYLGFKPNAMFCHPDRDVDELNILWRRSKSLVSETASRY